MDEPIHTGVSTTTSQEQTFSNLAKMFETYMRSQVEKEKKQDKEKERQEQKLNILTHQITQLQLDMEAARAREREPPVTTAPPTGPGTASGVAGLPAAYTAAPPLAPVQMGDPSLVRLEESDDIEHFLTTFERLAVVYGWPRRQWAIRLIPLLTGKARAAFVAMDPAYTQDYDQLKQAVLKKYEVNRDSYHQRFRSLDVPPGESPHELYTRLKDLFSKWVSYSSASKDDIREMVVLEQYLRVLHTDVKIWVKERDPDTAEEAAVLVDTYVAAHKGSENCTADFLSRTPQGASSEGGGNVTGQPVPYT